MSLLKVTNLSFTYPETSIKAVKDVSFELNQGEYVAVLGLNGSGKSTLARLLCGFLLADCGEIQFAPECMSGIVFQFPDDQIVSSIVESDTAFGPQNLGIAKKDVDKRVSECLSCVNLLDYRKSRTLSLSQGQKQKLAFAGISAIKPNFFVLDEPTSMLDEKSRKEILSLIENEVLSGSTVVHVTHDYEEAMRAQRIIAMNDGRIVFDGAQQDFVANSDILKQFFDAGVCTVDSSNQNKNSVCSLCMEKISFSYSSKNDQQQQQLFKDFSLELQSGSLVALMGSSGSGKTTLLELACGLLVPDEGKVLCSGQVALALQDSERSLFEEFAGDDVAFGPRNQGLKGRDLLQRVRKAMDMVGLFFDDFAERRTMSLSGGQKRRLSLAGIIALDCQVMLFDEPTAGLDPKSRRKIMEILVQLAKEGKTVVFSTHRTQEAELADRIVRLDESRPVRIFQDTKPNDKLIQRDFGLTQVAAQGGTGLLSFLRNAGLSFSQGAEKNMPVQKMPAVAKYVVFLVLFLVSFLTRTIASSGIGFGLILAYAFLAGYPMLRLVKSLAKILPWIVLFFLFQLLFLPSANQDTELFRVGFVSVTSGKLVSGVLMLLHLLCAFVCLAVFVFSINERQVLEGLAFLLKPLAVCGVPVRHVVLVAGIVFRFVPMLAAEAALIVKVQIIRGGLGQAKGFVSKIRKIFPLFVPLFLRTLKRSDALAEALTARHYS